MLPAGYRLVQVIVPAGATEAQVRAWDAEVRARTPGEAFTNFYVGRVDAANMVATHEVGSAELLWLK
jgi:hypothetical protein